MNQTILVTITGPSLTGKSKLAQLLKPFGFEELISTTTRPPRQGEINGVHYNFVDVSTFKAMVENNLMIENVQVGKNYYGVSKIAFDNVINKGKNGVIIVEPNGAQQVAKYCKKNNICLHQVFIDNPLNVLVERFLKRYKNDELAKDDVYAIRIIDMLKKEPKDWVEPAYNGTHHYDQIFTTFNPENEKDVVNQIIDAIDKKLTKKINFKRKL